MRNILFVIGGVIIAVTVFVNIKWHSDGSMLPIQPAEDGYAANTTLSVIEQENASESASKKLWIDTIMFARGHSFGYSGDISDWDGWYYDTVRVGEDFMLRYDRVGPFTLRLNLITRQTTVDLGSPDAAGRIKSFLSPIAGFKRFHKKYIVSLDSVYDEDYGMMRSWGEISFLADYADTSEPNADKINRYMVELVCKTCNTKMREPALSNLFLSHKQAQHSRKKNDGITENMTVLSDFIRDRTIKGWKKEDDLAYIGSASSHLDVRVHIANPGFVTFSVYDYSRMGTGHGGYTATFHTYDMKAGKKLSNNDLFKSQSLDKVKWLLFEVMAKDSLYSVRHDVKNATEVQELFEGPKSSEPSPEDPEWERAEIDSEFKLPQGALTHSGVVFSFQPYEIGCWAEGAYHFIIPYQKLTPYLSKRIHAILNLRR